MIISRNHIDLLIELVKTSFKMRYQNSILGFLWVLIKPYVMFGVLYIIFSNIIRSSVENYPLYLLTGVIFFTFTNEIITLGQMSLLERANIILKVNFPRIIAVISSIITGVINLGINLILIFIIAALTGVNPSAIGISYMLIVILTAFVWGVGISLLTSILTIRIRDLKNIIELGMFVMQYATPVFYSLEDSFVQNSVVQTILNLNPLTFFMNQFRAAIGVYGSIDMYSMLAYAVFGILVLVLFTKIFNYQVKRIAEYI